MAFRNGPRLGFLSSGMDSCDGHRVVIFEVAIVSFLPANKTFTLTPTIITVLSVRRISVRKSEEPLHGIAAWHLNCLGHCRDPHSAFHRRNMTALGNPIWRSMVVTYQSHRYTMDKCIAAQFLHLPYRTHLFGLLLVDVIT